MILTVNNQKWYDAAISSGFVDFVDLAVDHWQKQLEEAVTRLLLQVKNKEFHDFSSERATPKQDLREILLNMAQRVIDGDFDN